MGRAVRTIFDQDAFGVAEVDAATGRFIHINQKYCDMVGYSREELGNLAFQEITHPDDVSVDRENFKHVGDGSLAGFTREKRYIRKDGSVLWVNLTVYPVLSPGEKPSHMAIVEDITERKEAQAARRLSEEKYRIVADNTYDWEFWLGPDGQSLYVSPSCKRITGYAPEEFMADPGLFFRIVAPEDKPLVEGHLRDYEHRKFGELDFRIIDAAGRVRWISHACLPVYDRDGGFLGVRGSNRDSTERKEALDKQAEIERSYRTLFESMVTGVALHEVILDESGRPVDTRYIDISPSFEKITGCRREDVIGKRLTEIWPNAESVWLDRLGKVALTGTPAHFEQYSRAKGRYFEVHVYKAAPLRVISFSMDITENKLSANRYRGLVDTIPYGIQENDLDGVITFVNHGLARMLGYEESEHVGKVIFDFLDTVEEREKLRLFLKDLVDNQPVPTPYYARSRRKDGSLIDVKVDWNYKRNESGGLTGFISIITDITEKKRAEEEKERLQAQLLQSQKLEAIGTMAGGIAHDFNNIMTVVKSLTDLMIDKVGAPDPFYRYLQPISESTKMALNLVQQLLLFSSNKAKETSVFSLNDAVMEIKDLLEHLLSEDIRIELDLRHDPWNISADRGRIDQVITNLVINSGEAMPYGGTVVIRAENIVVPENCCKGHPGCLPGNYVCLNIEDTGEGIDPEVQKHIFEPFFTTKKAKNSGMGLAVVYGVVKDHNGWISVTSSSGAGAVFKVYLPATDTACDKEHAPVPMARKNGDGRRILLVEDEKWVRKATAMVLSEHGYTVFEAQNAESAICAFYREKGRFDLILSDVVMPGRSGLQMLGPIADINPRVPVILCSGHLDDKAQLSEIMKLGLTFIQKPYEIPELLSAIDEAINENANR